MKPFQVSAAVLAAGLLAAVPAFAQTTPPEKQKTQDGNSPTMTGPASGATKQRTQDGNSPAMTGPASGATKQRTQDGNSPTMTGPASGATKQRTQSYSHGETPTGAVKQN